jgi:hypothetical protein
VASTYKGIVNHSFINRFVVLLPSHVGITFTIITKCLREGEDSIVQHYAAKTIQNVATTDTQYYEKFATAETAQVGIVTKGRLHVFETTGPSIRHHYR